MPRLCLEDIIPSWVNPAKTHRLSRLSPICNLMAIDQSEDKFCKKCRNKTNRSNHQLIYEIRQTKSERMNAISTKSNIF